MLQTAQISVKRRDTGKDDLINDTDSFNISIAKLKKTFKLSYLVELVIGQEDDFLSGANNNLPNGSGSLASGNNNKNNISAGKKLAPINLGASTSGD